ncbi:MULTISPECIES: acyl-CoA dehydrogenase family protein [unclassified Arthrobacter]|uniref:acyl-CoA dehydrogenase family protein n=1 Tax=unclassified Arthrobacter TaxID=235627 RepID=UPI001D15599D|nr:MULTISPECIES: acyl-CoA dehydrogenase family protein [unclassified Arthrobacter]MCC3275040.1 acyl-CoA dehydrogenase family protein [Arthrobacter sp. zg-Y20]MCC3278988.1 acyl-CoA dehydrogenase family protein [Arthrobacter sp. zg-Y40]MCC9177364.1 acyl-CoA dehydrogenase family protein [Arthrobacter sp. zg-Y750]MDK1315197.1 acyl-CoA dehydrogenase family protein [Arthrobacter sp. zg.Y20]WIB05035.1 acyl-CoA dehydrogenase family protein [Arthrobacter sp. zg-Y20]
MERRLFEEDHELFREVVREFDAREVAPGYADWDAAHMMPRRLWKAAGEQGLLGLAVPEEFGGAGMPDYRFRAVMDEEFARANHLAVGLAFHLHDDMVLPHLLAYGSDELKERWLPGMVSGDKVTSVAWTEPGAGSDLRGIRTKAVRTDDGGWRISGQKTFIGNGISGDASLVLARTDGGTGRGQRDSFSMFMVEKTEGYSTGRQLDKMGLKASDTAELFFDDVFVPSVNLVGEVGRGLEYAEGQLPQGRLAIAVASSAVARRIFEATVEYTKERNAFGERIADFQNSRFALADIETEVEATEAYVDSAVTAFNEGKLDAVSAAKAKLWASERAKSITDRCLQLHGGYGYILEYPVAQAFLAARLLTIFGGTSEIMREVIGRGIVR